MKKVFWGIIFCVVILSTVCVASVLEYSFKYNYTDKQIKQYNITYKTYCLNTTKIPYTNTTTNQTINITTQKYYNCTITQKLNLTYNTTKTLLITNMTAMFISADNTYRDNHSMFKLTLQNTNATQEFLYFKEVKSGYAYFTFSSDYEKSERVVFLLFGKTYNYSVMGQTLISLPLDYNYTSFNHSRVNSSQLNNDNVRVWIKYFIPHKKIWKNLTFPVPTNSKPNIFLVRNTNKFVVNEPVRDKLVVTTKNPIVNCSIESNNTEYEGRCSISGENVIYTFTPLTYGLYTVTYKVFDVFGNEESLTTEMDVKSLGSWFFKDIRVPSLKVGEEAKFDLYDYEALQSNYTLLDIHFYTHNESYQDVNGTPSTIKTTKDITYPDVRKYVDFQLIDGVGNRHELNKDKKTELQSKKVTLYIKLLGRGNLSMRIGVVVPKELETNNELTVNINAGDVSIFEKQEFNVNGRLTTCELVGFERGLGEAERKCWTEFPLTDNLDNLLVLMTRNDFNSYTEKLNTGFEEQKRVLNEAWDKTKDWRNTFLLLFILLCGVVLWLVWFYRIKEWPCIGG